MPFASKGDRLHHLHLARDPARSGNQPARGDRNSPAEQNEDGRLWLRRENVVDVKILPNTCVEAVYWALSLCSAAASHGSPSRPPAANLPSTVLLCDRQALENSFFIDLYEQVSERLGVPQLDEIYAFIPAIGLGGGRSVSHIQKVRMDEEMLILSRL